MVGQDTIKCKVPPQGWTLSWLNSVSFYESSLRLALTDGFTVLEIAADTVANKAFSVEHLC